MKTTTKTGWTAKLTTEERLLVDLRNSPIAIRELNSCVELNAAANLTRKGWATWRNGRYEITAKGEAHISWLEIKVVH